MLLTAKEERSKQVLSDVKALPDVWTKMRGRVVVGLENSGETIRRMEPTLVNLAVLMTETF